jgi:GIY-YIG catalytic domain
LPNFVQQIGRPEGGAVGQLGSLSKIGCIKLPEGGALVKGKYLKKSGIYLWVNSINNKSYVGKSVDLFNRLNKNYLSNSYIFKNKEKMAICSAIYKYGIDKFSFYILEIIEKPELDLLSYKKLLSIRENYPCQPSQPSPSGSFMLACIPSGKGSLAPLVALCKPASQRVKARHWGSLSKIGCIKLPEGGTLVGIVLLILHIIFKLF